MALPHGESQHVAGELVGSVGVLVDLAADFRLRDPGITRSGTDLPTARPNCSGASATGCLSCSGKSWRVTADRGARLLPDSRCTGGFPLREDRDRRAAGIVVDAASGLSGAGSSLTEATHFAVADGDFSAYGLLSHRHTPEIEQAAGASVLFTPHLAPMTRGILATCYMRAAPGSTIDTDGALGILADTYAGEPFIVVSERRPPPRRPSGPTPLI